MLCFQQGLASRLLPVRSTLNDELDAHPTNIQGPSCVTVRREPIAMHDVPACGAISAENKFLCGRKSTFFSPPAGLVYVLVLGPERAELKVVCLYRSKNHAFFRACGANTCNKKMKQNSEVAEILNGKRTNSTCARRSSYELRVVGLVVWLRLVLAASHRLCGKEPRHC